MVVGPVMDGLMSAGESARAALSGLNAVRAWPGAPRPVDADDLLPERMLLGDQSARRALIEDGYRPLATGPAHLLETVLGLPGTGRVTGGNRPGAVRPPQHGAISTAAE